MFKSLLLKGRTMCILILCTLSSLVVTAQTKITGKVIGSDDKQPIIGATIKIKGTNTGVVTDVNGDFTLSGKTGYVLVVSYVGYQSKQVTVSGPSLGTITLDVANSSLNEVVVTGYTSQRKKDIAGAVAVVDINDAKKIPSSSTDQILQGQAAGVTVVTQGAPGAGSLVYIRGISNFGNSQPLYVIDGVQGGSMSDVNPNDIESIQVLKDAGAAAIYGVSGGNGVIIITTKRGKAGKSMFTYDGYYGTQVPKGGNVFNVLSPQDMSRLAYVAGDNTVQHSLYPGGAGTLTAYGWQGPGVAAAGDNPDLTKYHFDPADPSVDYLIQKFNQQGTDWFHEIFKSAPIQYHTISASGSNEKNNYYMSVGYLNQQGTEIYTYQKRYEARVNTTFNLNDHVRIGENGYLFYKQAPAGGFNNQNEGDPISYAYRMMPQIPVYDISGVQYGGTYDGPGGEPLGNSSNPVAVLNQLSHQKFRNWNVQGNVFAEVDFLKHFTAKTAMGGNYSNQYYNGYTTNTYMDYEGHFNPNNATEQAWYYTNYNWTNTIRYQQVFGKHNVSVVAGYEQKESSGRNVYTYGTDLFTATPEYSDVSNTTKGRQLAAGPSYQPTSTQSLFGRLDYIYADKYILGATIRRDGFSAFFPGRQWGTFPSVSLAWRVSQEDFLKSTTWLNDLKLRASYGVAGNNSNVPGSNPYSNYGGSFGNGYYDISGVGSTLQGFVVSQYGNVKTSWETDKVLNFGIDASIINHLDVTLEVYKKSISGLLFGDQAAATIGGGNRPLVNIGDVQNTGFDLAATYHGTAGRDFKFSIGANITAYKNKITSIPGNYFDEVGTRVNNVVREQVGHPIGSFFGYKVDGILTAADMANASVAKYSTAQEGSFKYADINNDGKIDDSDRTFLGNPNPKFTYGLNLNASYKDFDLAVVLYGSYGNKDFRYTRYFTDFYTSFQGGKSYDALHSSYGSPGVTNPTVPIQSDANSMGTTQISSFYVEGGSFLKMRVAQLGYSFSPAALKMVGVTKLHVYVQGTNLFTITKYKGLDPELPPNSFNGNNAIGIDQGNYPNNQRQWILGVNMSF